MPAPYPEEFRRRAVELARQPDAKVAEVARDLGVAESGLRRWMAQADVDESKAEGLTTAEKRELVELRRRTRVLEMRTRSSNGRRRISPRRTSSKKGVPGGRPACRRRLPRRARVPVAGGLDPRVLRTSSTTRRSVRSSTPGRARE